MNKQTVYEFMNSFRKHHPLSAPHPPTTPHPPVCNHRRGSPRLSLARSARRRSLPRHDERQPPPLRPHLHRRPARDQGHRRLRPRLVRQLPQVLRERPSGLPGRRHGAAGRAPQVQALGAVGRRQLAHRIVPRVAARAKHGPRLPALVRGRRGRQHQRTLPQPRRAAAGRRRRGGGDARRRAAAQKWTKAGDGRQKPANGRGALARLPRRPAAEQPRPPALPPSHPPPFPPPPPDYPPVPTPCRPSHRTGCRLACCACRVTSLPTWSVQAAPPGRVAGTAGSAPSAATSSSST